MHAFDHTTDSSPSAAQAAPRLQCPGTGCCPKRARGNFAALLRLRPSRIARRRIAHWNSATPRPPRARDAASGRGKRAAALAAASRLSAVRRTISLTGDARLPKLARDDTPAPERAGPQRMRQLNFDLKTLQARHREGAFNTRRDRAYVLDQAAHMLHVGFRRLRATGLKQARQRAPRRVAAPGARHGDDESQLSGAKNPFAPIR